MAEKSPLLPAGYSELCKIDLKRDKKLYILINIMALLIAAVLIIAGLFIVPIGYMFDFSHGLSLYIIKWLVLLLGCIAYIVLHEAVHGIFMYAYSGIKPHFGFKGIYAYAGSQAYFTKSKYIIIALAPIVILGAVLLILNLALPTSWFWPVYFIQATNISGAAGDIYVSLKMRKMPADILVKDTGTDMTVYSRKAG